MTARNSFALSPQQQRILRWLGDASVDRPFHTLRLSLDGNIDRQCLLRAVNVLLRKHEILRTRVSILGESGAPKQIVSGFEPLTRLPRDWADGDDAPWTVALADDADGSTIRMRLNVLNGDEHAVGRILGLLSDHYLNFAHEQKIIQYPDLAQGFAEVLTDVEGRGYWGERLGGGVRSAGTLATLAGHSRAPAAENVSTQHTFDLRRLSATFAGSHSTVPDETAFPIWVLFLSKLCQEAEVVVGYRDAGLAGLEGVAAIGPTSKTLLLPFKLDWSRPVPDLIRQVRAQWESDLLNAPYYDPDQPFAAPAHPLLMYQPFTVDVGRFGGISVAAFERDFVAEPFSLKLRAEGSQHLIVADPVAFTSDRLEEVHLNFTRWLAFCENERAAPMGVFEWLTRDPAQMPFSARERGRVSGHELIHVGRAVSHWAVARPDQIAVTDVCGSMTFAELDRRIKALAALLRHKGVLPGQVVALHLERGRDWPSYWLACWHLNATVLPLSTRNPASRLLSLLEQSCASHIVSSSEIWKGMRATLIRPDEESLTHDYIAAPAPLDPLPESIAYVLYTSGSTGAAKGVLIPHSGLSSYLRWAQKRYASSKGGGTLVHSELTFDFTQTSLWLPLLAGEPLHFTEPRADSMQLMRALETARDLSFIKLTPTHVQALASLEAHAGATLHWPDHVIIGGEALTGGMLPPSLKHCASSIHNEYGPTETAVGCSVFSAKASELAPGNVPIGQPCEGNGFFALDAFLNRVPPGAIGELHIDGEQLAVGYLGAPMETAARFVPHPYTEASGARLYRTGDRVRRLAGNQYEFVGREDSQIKLRGHRVELAEITCKLLEHPQVLSAYTLLLKLREGTDSVVSYVVLEGATIDELRPWMEQCLPAYMVPNELLAIAALPYNENGKVEEQALVRFRLARVDTTGPRNEKERVLLALWQQVLGTSSLGIDTDFFSAGGDSIRSIEVIVLARREGLRLSVEQLFEKPTIRLLAEVVEATSQPADAALITAPFELVSAADRALLPVGVSDAYPMTQLQLGMIFHNQEDGAQAYYHDIFSFRLELELEIDRLRRAARNLVVRHPALRTTFDLTTCSEPLQLVWENGVEIVEYEDISLLAEPEQAALIARSIESEKLRGFDVERLPLVRFKVHKLGDRHIRFTTSFHHAVMDGWSDQQIHTELFAEYRALCDQRPFTLAPPLSNYRDYVALERRALSSAQTRTFWAGYLAGYVPPQSEDLDQPAAGSVQASELGRLRLGLAENVQNGLKQAALALQVPLKSVLIAAHFRALAVITGRSDIVSCVVTNCRLENEDSERSVGLYINSLPMRLKVANGDWRQLILQAYDAERRIFPNRHLPFAAIQQAAHVGRLSPALFYFTSFHNGIGRGELVSIEELAHEVTSFPLLLSFNLDPGSAAVSFGITFNRRSFSDHRAGVLGDIYAAVLEGVSVNLDGRFDSQQHLPAARQSVLVHPAICEEDASHDLVTRFESQARRLGNRLAVTAHDGCLTFSKLNEQANRLAHCLIAAGVRTEDVVPVLAGRGSLLVVAILAVLKTGGSFVLLDGDEPAAKLQTIMARSSHAVVVREYANRCGVTIGYGATDPADSVRLAAFSARDPGLPVLPRQAAYRMYTSGSTGTPKCVVVERSAYANVLEHFRKTLEITDEDRILATSAVTFDISLLEIGLPLVAGAHLTIVPRSEIRDSESLAGIIDNSRATVVQATPTLWSLLRKSGWAGDKSIKALCGGEKLPKVLAAWLVDTTAAAWNVYGPTETTIWSSAKRLGVYEHSLGIPIARTHCYVLDASLSPVPEGSIGELLVGGAGVSRGYENRADLTAAAFVPDPFSPEPGARMYATGDYVYLNSRRELEFTGRKDRQIKLRGYRLEIEEIEGWLERHPQIREALVTHESVTTQTLIAYLVPQPGIGLAGDAQSMEAAGLTSSALNTYLSKVLPAYAIPARYQLMDAIPLTRNGKVDYGALPKPSSQRPALAARYVAPSHAVEGLLHDLWSRALKIERIGVNDNFVELGGNSLIAVLIVSQLRKLFEIDLAVAAIFQAPTIASLSTYVLNRFPQAQIPIKVEILEGVRKLAAQPAAAGVQH